MTIENTKPFEGKTCFVITPIGGESTEIRREADGIIDEVLIPVLEDELGFTVEVAHRVDTSGSITQQVIQSVIDSDFAICNLATLNPNVMYELALRHAARKPVVTIAPKGTSLPFDISDDRVVFYKNDIAGANQLKADLHPKTIAAMEDETPDNPVYRAIKSGKVMQEVHAEGGANAAIFDAIEGLSRKVDSFQAKKTRTAWSLNDTTVVRSASGKRIKKLLITLEITRKDARALSDDDVIAVEETLSSTNLLDSSLVSIRISEMESSYIQIQLRGNEMFKNQKEAIENCAVTIKEAFDASVYTCKLSP